MHSVPSSFVSDCGDSGYSEFGQTRSDCTTFCEGALFSWRPHQDDIKLTAFGCSNGGLA